MPQTEVLNPTLKVLFYVLFFRFLKKTCCAQTDCKMGSTISEFFDPIEVFQLKFPFSMRFNFEFWFEIYINDVLQASQAYYYMSVSVNLSS